MIPTFVHRYAFPIKEAIEALLGDAAGDADTWRIRVEEGQVVVDIISPATVTRSQTAPNEDETSQEANNSKPVETDPETSRKVVESKPERKGGELAKKAGIICAEKGFWAFAEVRSEEEAKQFIYAECGISSRVDLDHDDEAGRKFRDIYASYQNWLNDT